MCSHCGGWIAEASPMAHILDAPLTLRNSSTTTYPSSLRNFVGMYEVLGIKPKVGNIHVCDQFLSGREHEFCWPVGVWVRMWLWFGTWGLRGGWGALLWCMWIRNPARLNDSFSACDLWGFISIWDILERNSRSDIGELSTTTWAYRIIPFVLRIRMLARQQPHIL